MFTTQELIQKVTNITTIADIDELSHCTHFPVLTQPLFAAIYHSLQYYLQLLAGVCGTDIAIRIKTPESTFFKLLLYDCDWNRVYDLIAFRRLVGDVPQAHTLCTQARTQFPIPNNLSHMWDPSYDYALAARNTLTNPPPSGYRSLDFYIQFPDKVLAELRVTPTDQLAINDSSHNTYKQKMLKRLQTKIANNPTGIATQLHTLITHCRQIHAVQGEPLSVTLRKYGCTYLEETK